MSGVDDAVNMGSGRVYSIRAVVDVLSELTGMSGRIEWDRSKPNGQAYRAYDLTKLDATGFAPKYSLRAGLEETWNWYCARAAEFAAGARGLNSQKVAPAPSNRASLEAYEETYSLETGVHCFADLFGPASGSTLAARWTRRDMDLGIVSVMIDQPAKDVPAAVHPTILNSARS